MSMTLVTPGRLLRCVMCTKRSQVFPMQQDL